MSTGFAPGIEIFREFASINSAAASRLPAYVFGPAADVYPYVAGQANVGKLGQYRRDPLGLVDGAAQNIFPYPERRIGGIVDLDTVKIYVTNALLKYAEDISNTVVKKSRNTLRLPNLVLVTNAAATVTSSLPTRQVQVGDVVRIVASVPTGTVEVNTYITGLIPDINAASVGSAIAGAANAVEPTDPPIETAVPTANGSATANADIAVTVDASSYNGLNAARLTEVYTVTALNSTAAGAVTGARFRITSADGLDNVEDRILGAGGVLALGSRGAAATFVAEAGESISIGETWVITVANAYDAPVPSISGSYTGRQSRVYIIEVIEGNSIADGPVVRVSTEDGTDQSGPFTLVEGTTSDNTSEVALGSYGLTVKFATESGFVTGDRWKVVATAATDGAIRTIATAHSLPDAIVVDQASHNIKVEFMLRRNIELPKDLGGSDIWVARENDVLVAPGVTLTAPDIVNGSGNEISLKLESPVMNTVDSQVEAAYRVWHPVSTQLQSIDGSSSLEGALTGPTSQDNPLKLGLSIAQAEAGGTPLYYFCVGDPSVEANWDAALSVVSQTRSVHGLVPLTQDPVILAKVYAHCVAQSTPQRRRHRRCWLSVDVPEIRQITDSVNTVLATITDDPDTGGTQNSLVTITSTGVDLLELGVRSGDVLRYNYNSDIYGNITYSTVLIDTVVNADTLKIRTPLSAAEPIARKIEIHRSLGSADLAADLQTAVAAYGEKACVVMPEYEYGTQTIPGYFVCCALAARRAAYRPHQPMTNTEMTGVTGTPWEAQFDETLLNSLAYSGFFMLTRDPANGIVSVRHAITAGDYDNVLIREESVQANADDIVYRIDDQLKPLYGRLNANEETILRIKTELDSLEASLLSEGLNSKYGPQVISLDSSNVRVGFLERDVILVDVIAETPVPANRIRAYLYFV